MFKIVEENLDAKLWYRAYMMSLNLSSKLHLKHLGDDNSFLQQCVILVLYIKIILNMIGPVIGCEVKVAE